MFPVDLRAHPFIEIPVEAQGRFGGPGTVDVGVGKVCKSATKDAARFMQMRDASHQFPGARASEWMFRIEIAKGFNRLAVRCSLFSSKQQGGHDVKPFLGH